MITSEPQRERTLTFLENFRKALKEQCDHPAGKREAAIRGSYEGILDNSRTNSTTTFAGNAAVRVRCDRLCRGTQLRPRVPMTRLAAGKWRNEMKP
jgi:hypothetical protein